MAKRRRRLIDEEFNAMRHWDTHQQNSASKYSLNIADGHDRCPKKFEIRFGCNLRSIDENEGSGSGVVGGWGLFLSEPIPIICIVPSKHAQ